MGTQTTTKNIISTISGIISEINSTDVREKYVIVCKNKHQPDFMHITEQFVRLQKRLDTLDLI